MPEMPEVEGLVAFLGERTTGRTITRASVAAIAALKTYDPPISALEGASITGAERRGKFVVLYCGADLHLVFHLAKAGWLRWYDALPTTLLKPGKSPIALRVALDDGSGFDLTEAGTKKSLAVYVVRDPAEVPGIARLGPDPLDPSFTRDAFAALLDDRRMQIKGLLRDQGGIAGIGNAYSDEVDRLFTAMQETLAEAVAAAAGKPPADLKDAKRRGMRVHARRGEACPVCGDEVRSVFFADRSLEYCPTCQTGGKVLADRRLSRLLK